MRDQNSTPSEYPESWDTGTYQTGASKPNKNQSGMITALLITTIFLGGIASAMGVMNIRLLTKLVKQENPVLPLSVEGTGGTVGSFLREQNDCAPQIPEDSSLELNFEKTAAAAVLTPEQILQKNQMSMVTVSVENTQGGLQSGLGLVLSSDGYLLTNAHVTENAGCITVTLSDGTQVQAALVGCDAYSDLSVLYVPCQGLTEAVFADAQGLSAGYEVFGPEENTDGSLTAGRVRSGSRELSVGGQSVRWMETNLKSDAGPVFNEYGQVTGFLCRYFGDEHAQGLMVTNSLLRQIATQLVEEGAVSGRPSLTLQVQELSNFCQEYWDLSGGLEITALTEGGSAQQKGLLSGDILLSLDGVPLTTQYQFFETLLAHSPGDSVTLEVFRAGQRFTVTLPVEQIP